MDFLKSAVASAISGGPPFPYSFGDRVDVDDSIWTLYNGTRREDGSNCSIFSFDVPANKSRLPLARNAVKKLRTLRHPGVIKVLDTVETDSYIYVATERLVPLRWHIKRKSMSEETIKWGLFSIAQTVKFINDDASSIHGSLKAASVYTSESGEWKLGGFEVLSSLKDDEAVIYRYGSLVPESARYMPPELAKSGWETIKKNPATALDAYNFGILLFETFNGDFLGSDQVGQTKGIPSNMQPAYKRLINANPKSRSSVAHFLDQGRRNGGFLDTPLIKLTEGVDSLGMKSENEREEFLSDLDQLSDDFPEEYFKMKILPELLKSVEFGGGGPKVFSVVMKIAQKLSDEDFDAKVTPVVVRLFQSPDRAIRVCLLDNLPVMIDRLPQKIVNDKIYPQMVTGFTDVAPLIREQTVKAVLTIITKLSDRTINSDLLKQLARTSNDEQPGIRTNTTICLGKIARSLGVSTRSKVLIAAFTRSLRDPFVHARNASLQALTATADCFTDEDIAGKILPAVCPLLLDKEKLVRDQANKSVDTYLRQVRKAASQMPDTVLPPPAPDAGRTNSNSTTPRMGTPQPSEAASWTGWAISSFTNKISTAAGDIEPSSPSANTLALPPSTLETRPVSAPVRASASASALHRQAITSPPPTSTRTSTSSASASNAADYFQDVGEAGEDDFEAWGDMDDDDTAFKDAVDEQPKAPAKPTVSAKPFEDDGEPDFAGWLAAQAGKKTGSKPLPKGLAKPGSAGARPNVLGAGSRKVSAAAPAKPLVKKVIDTKPKEAGDDDGWGDGW
ncbi:hypothetical protein V501_02973 [Pseudogymnoascus sp. VKM F-4519 (FW-2642)]|nr:hypothetical protein V501_02973 [Pseudogymnoascus sp. VKM F-4519 (FW-2642)]